MRKRLYFDNTVKISPYEVSVLIENGKIREYYGFNFTNHLIASIIPNPNIKKGDLDYKTMEMAEDFTLSRVSNYDKKKSGIKANYKIDSHELFQLTLKDVYIRLNFFEKFFIDYSKKESIFHQVKFAQKLLIVLLLTIPTAIILSQLKSCNGNAKDLKINGEQVKLSNDIKTGNNKSVNSFLVNENQETDSLKCKISVILEAFQNNDQISADLMLRFLRTFGKDCRNNVEFSEFSNETLYKVIQKNPQEFVITLENNLNQIDFEEIIFNLENPLHDLIDLDLTINKIADTEIEKTIKDRLIIAINSANWDDAKKIQRINGLNVILFIPDSTQFKSIVDSENSQGIYEASSDFGYYGNKVVELYKDSVINVSFSDKRFFIVKNEVIDKMKIKSAYGFILVNKDKYKIETGVMVDIGIQQMISDYFIKSK